MSKWKNYFSILRCLNCGGNLRISDASEQFGKHPHVNGELSCSSCGRSYPVFQDIPVIFNDSNRTKILIDSTAYRSHLKSAEEKMKQASQVAGDELGRFKGEDEAVDALNWEILLWERWKQFDEGFLEFSKDKIEKYLENDNEGGGRSRFFSEVLSPCGDIAGKRLSSFF